MFEQRLKNLLTYLGIINLCMIVIVIVLNIVLRFVFNSPLMWSIDMCAIMVVWMTFIVMGVNHRENRHFRIDVVAMLLPRKGQKVLSAIADFLTFCCLLFVLYSTIVSIVVNRSMTLTAIEISVAYAFYLPLLIGVLTYIFYILREFQFARRRDGEPTR